MKASKKHDVLTFGRASIDLFSNDIGAAFEDITSFGAFIGGSSTNIAVSCSRLSLDAALLTGVGEDQVGRFVLRFLKDEGVTTDYIPVVDGRTPAVLVGVQPPDTYPLVFYRSQATDLNVTIDHVLAAKLDAFRVIILSGNALSRDPSRTATLFAAEHAQHLDVPVFLDLDFRVDQWWDVRAYGVMVRALLPQVDVVIGTEEEVLAASLSNRHQIKTSLQEVSSPEIKGDLNKAIQNILAQGVDVLIVKRGARGCSIYKRGEKEVKVPGFPVEILSVLGAGDAFAGGLTYGFLQGWDWYKACRMGNACGALVVTRHGCANFMPTCEEARSFIEEQGGF